MSLLLRPVPPSSITFTRPNGAVLPWPEVKTSEDMQREADRALRGRVTCTVCSENDIARLIDVYAFLNLPRAMLIFPTTETEWACLYWEQEQKNTAILCAMRTYTKNIPHMNEVFRKKLRAYNIKCYATSFADQAFFSISDYTLFFCEQIRKALEKNKPREWSVLSAGVANRIFHTQMAAIKPRFGAAATQGT